VGSIELYLAIQQKIEVAQAASKEFHILSIDIFKTLTLSREHRPIPAKDYLERKYEEYCKLIDKSNLVSKNLRDHMTIPAINTEESKV